MWNRRMSRHRSVAYRIRDIYLRRRFFVVQLTSMHDFSSKKFFFQRLYLFTVLQRRVMLFSAALMTALMTVIYPHEVVRHFHCTSCRFFVCSTQVFVKQSGSAIVRGNGTFIMKRVHQQVQNSQENICCICRQTCESHHCCSCGEKFHPFCGTAVGDKGYGGKVLCMICSKQQNEEVEGDIEFEVEEDNVNVAVTGRV